MSERRADLEATIEADFAQVWHLVSDFDAWPGLMPHVHAVDTLDRRGGRSLIRVEAWRGWLPVTLVCGVEGVREEGRGKRDEWGGEGVFHRWYVAGPWQGVVETWTVERIADDVRVSVVLKASGPLGPLARRLVILPLARRTLEMVSLLGEAHRDAHQGLE